MATRRLTVVTAGLRQPSSTRLLADRLAESVGAALGDRGNVTTTQVVDLREHAHDLASHLTTGFPGERLRVAVDAVVGADGLVAVTPIFGASYSGLFKTFFDILDAESLVGKPVLAAATGGTARHSLALDFAVRPLFAYFKAPVMPTAVFAATEDWGSDAGVDGRLADRIDRAARELADAMATHEPRRVADPFADLIPFEQLLADGDSAAK